MFGHILLFKISQTANNNIVFLIVLLIKINGRIAKDMITVPGTISLSTIQDLYIQLDKSAEHPIDLRLPKKFDKSDFGLLFSFLQFLATWLRSAHSGKLVLPVTDEELIKYFEENEFAYPSVVLAWEKEIIDENGKNIKSNLKNPSKDYFIRMDFFELKGNSVPIYCFDHDKSNRGLSKHFYNSNRELVSEDALGYNLFRAFQKVGSFNPSVFNNNIKSNLESFIAIIHELFTNTHEHAKTNELGYNLYPNIRAVQIKFHRKNLKNYLDQVQYSKALSKYFGSDFDLNAQEELYLLEISILDSGPGFVKRYKKISDYDIGIEDEVAIIKDCLYRHNTSSEGLKATVKGIGLDRVLQTLDGKGFLRIKTGRADVVRDMKNNHYHHHHNSSEIQLNDFQSNSEHNFTIYPVAEGTLISIYYPLDYKGL